MGVLFLCCSGSGVSKGFCTGRYVPGQSRGALLGIAIVFVSHLPTAVALHRTRLNLPQNILYFLVWSMIYCEFLGWALGVFFCTRTGASGARNVMPNKIQNELACVSNLLDSHEQSGSMDVALELVPQQFGQSRSPAAYARTFSTPVLARVWPRQYSPSKALHAECRLPGRWA